MPSFLREAFQTLLISLVIFVALSASVKNFRVEGASMEPTLHSGQYLLVNKMVYARLPQGWLARLSGTPARGDTPLYLFHTPRRGDVIVFHHPRQRGRDLVKRIIGESGDPVEVRYGQVYLNGSLLEEPYLSTTPDYRSSPPLQVPPGHYFVLGDNRGSSTDSRDWGVIPSSAIVGKAWVTYWPLARLGLVSPVDTTRP